MKAQHRKMQPLYKLQYLCLLSMVALIAACGSGDSDFGDNDNRGGQVTDFITIPVDSSSSSASPNASEFLDTPIVQAEANTRLVPAFEGQTRANAMGNGYELNIQAVRNDLVDPWGLDFLPDGRLIVTEQAGRFKLITQEGNVTTLFGQPPMLENVFGDSQGQAGLLDVSVSPTYESDGLILASYVELDSLSFLKTNVVALSLSADETRMEGFGNIIFRQPSGYSSYKHFGSRIAWSKDGDVFITLGDRGVPGQAQNLANTVGAIVRVSPEGEIPADNPFVGEAEADTAIWSYGHRNVQGAAVHPDTGELWTIEHGPQGGDELNIAQAGKNYGWPVISYGQNYDGTPIGDGLAQQDDMEQPIYYWDPSIAPAGMMFYTGDMFEEWQGDILATALKGQAIIRLRVEPAAQGSVTAYRVIGEEHLSQGLGRVRDIAQAPDGSIWWITDSGLLNKMSPL